MDGDNNKSRMSDLNQNALLDVEWLLESSEPRPRGRWGWAFMLALVGLLLGGELLASRQPELRAAIHAVTALGTVLLVGAAVLASATLVRAQRAEQQAVAALEEMVQLRRWTDAYHLVGRLLSHPMRLSVNRARALIWLSVLLARQGRYADVLTVEEYVLAHVPMDPATAQGVRLGRAMAMLHEDHLVDVDRAIGELRRGPGGSESAGLALVEMYRDVKTGHPTEAIEIFEARSDAIRQQLGHRAADAWALAARAYDQLGQVDQAAAAYENATLLGNEADLHRRYPELKTLTGRYQPALVPMEVA